MSIEVSVRRLVRDICVSVALMSATCSTQAQSQDAMVSTGLSDYTGTFHFARPSLETLHRIYRVNTSTGQVSVCVYVKPGDKRPDGYTECIEAAADANVVYNTAPYRLMLAGHKEAEGVFRINIHTGEVVYCFLSEKALICPVAEKTG